MRAHCDIVAFTCTCLCLPAPHIRVTSFPWRQGREDLRLDERFVQLLRGANALLRAHPDAAARRLAAPTFGVAPLGARLGLLQWVAGGVPLWGLFRAWQARPRGAWPPHGHPRNPLGCTLARCI